MNLLHTALVLTGAATWVLVGLAALAPVRNSRPAWWLRTRLAIRRLPARNRH